MQRVVVIGTGQGGFQVAASLRQEGFTGQISMIGDEPGLPYQRPPLSKEYLKEGDETRLLLRPASFYEQQKIRIIDNLRVTAIRRAEQEVETSDGNRIAYDHLVLATGSRNRTLPIPGTDLPGVMNIRTLADARQLLGRLGSMRQVTVVGGGFIGLEFAAVAMKRGIQVNVVEATSRLMSRAVSPAISEHFLQAHRSWGVKVHLDCVAAAVAGQDRDWNVALKDGSDLSGDTIIIAAGVVANDELAADAGLETADGIVVDEYMLTSDPNISALGDCCRFTDPVSGAFVRLESVQAATDHARTIAARLAGTPRSYNAVPWFWSNQAELRLQIAGYSAGADNWHVTETDGQITVLCFAGDNLAAVETVNNAGSHMAARKIFGRIGRLDRSVLAASDYDLKAVLKTI